MTPEELEEKWKELDLRVKVLEEAQHKMIDSVVKNNPASAQQKLAEQYKKSAIICPAVGLCCVLIQSHVISIPLTIAFALFFIAAGCMDAYLYKGIKSIDMNRSGVEEVIRKARHYKKMHHIFQIILLTACVPILTALFMEYANEYSRWGMLAGMALGSVLGIIFYKRMMRNYRSIIKSTPA